MPPSMCGQSITAIGIFLLTQVMLVYFVGGVTYMEIAALRFLSAQKECEYMQSWESMLLRL